MARVRIRNREEFEEWLKDQPQEVAVAIAARAVMRALPALEMWLAEYEDKAVFSVLPTFRAISTLWFVTVELNFNHKVIRDVAFFIDLALLDYNAALNTNIQLDAASSAIRSAHAASFFHNSDAVSLSAFALADAVPDNDTSNAALRTSFATFLNKAWETVEYDVRFLIEKGSDGIPEIMFHPLWLDGMPAELRRLWETMKNRLLNREGEHWEVWTNWYDARLDPSRSIPCYSPPVPELERKRVLLPEEVWEAGPAKANAEIKRLVDICLLRHIKPLPSGYSFEVRGPQYVLQTLATDSDLAVAQDPGIRALGGALLEQTTELRDIVSEKFAREENEYFGWEALPRRLEELQKYLAISDPQALAGNITLVWNALVRLTTVIEKDERIRNDLRTNLPPLDGEIRSNLSALVTSLAAYVRSFPSARELDDAARAFRIREELLDPAKTIFDKAGEYDLLSRENLEMLLDLLRAAKEGDLQSGQGGKAGAAGVSSVRNFIYTMLSAVAGVYMAAVAQEAAPDSILIKKSVDLLLSSEKQIIEIFQDDDPGRLAATKNLLSDLREQHRKATKDPKAAIAPQGNRRRKKSDE